MNQENNLLLGVMLLSSLLQFFAALMAIRLIRPSGAFLAWIILACGFTLQGIRRILSLVEVVNGRFQGDLTLEILGLAISLLMLLGIMRFRPLFDDINRTHQELLEKQDKLARANHELESFVSTVSHDLRNPLSVIIGLSEHLRNNPGTKLDQQTLDCLEDIETQGVRMSALLESLLALAKVGYVKRPVEPVDVNKILEEALGEYEHLLVYKKVSVEVGALPNVHVPEVLLADVFKNLIGNALCYGCKEGDSISIWGEREQNTVKFCVRDHGPGIPQEERERIFEMFYRGSTGKASKGSGIGLAIVQKIAQLYNGKVWVEETPRGGSTFCLQLQDA